MVLCHIMTKRLPKALRLGRSQQKEFGYVSLNGKDNVNVRHQELL